MRRVVHWLFVLLAVLAGPRRRASIFRWLGARVGKDCRLWLTSLGTEPYLISIGDHCTITAGCRLITHDGATWVLRHTQRGIDRFGKIEIRDNCFLGVDAIVLPNVTIGPNAVVGAGALVTRDVPPDCVVGGVPARVLMTLEEYKSRCIAESLGISGDPAKRRRQLIAHFWGGGTRGDATVP